MGRTVEGFVVDSELFDLQWIAPKNPQKSNENR